MEVDVKMSQSTCKWKQRYIMVCCPARQSKKGNGLGFQKIKQIYALLKTLGKWVKLVIKIKNMSTHTNNQVL